MKKTNLLSLVVVTLLIALCGCKPPADYDYRMERERKEREAAKCNCGDLPERYVVNMNYTDHAGDAYFPHEIKWSWGEYEDPPTGIYCTKGVSSDGTSYYYSQEMPKRQENGLVKIERVNGSIVYVDFKDIEVTLTPCQPTPLDSLSQERFDYGEQYSHHRDHVCPYHKEGEMGYEEHKRDDHHW